MCTRPFGRIWQGVYTVVFVAFVGFAVLAMFRTSQGMQVHAPRYTGLIFISVLLVAGVVIGAYLLWRSRQKNILSAADWLTLVEVLGLAANVKDAARKG